MNGKLVILVAAVFTLILVVLAGSGIGQRVLAQPDGQGAAAKAEREAEEAEKKAEKAEEKAEEAEEKAEKLAEEAEEARERAEEARKEAEEAREAESRASTEDSAEADEGSGEAAGPQGGVTLEMEGEPGTEFSGSCAVGDQEGEPIAGRVPQTFDYRTDGQELDCRIRNESGGDLKVVLSSGNDRSVQSIGTQGGTIELTYSDNVLSSTTTSSSSGGGSGSQSVTSSSSSQSSYQSGGSSRQSLHQSSRQVVSSD